MRMRWGVSITLTAILFVIYYGYILIVAFGKTYLAEKVGVYTNNGILWGVGVIVAVLGLTGASMSSGSTIYDDKEDRRNQERTLIGRNELWDHPWDRSMPHRSSFASYFFPSHWGSLTGQRNGHNGQSSTTPRDAVSPVSKTAWRWPAINVGRELPRGIAGMVSLKGHDGMIYATGWLVGWPALMYLLAEPLRNLGKYTFADVVAYRLNKSHPHRRGHRRNSRAADLHHRPDGRRRQPDQTDVRICRMKSPRWSWAWSC